MKRRVWAAASAVMMATTAFGAQAVLAAVSYTHLTLPTTPYV